MDAQNHDQAHNTRRPHAKPEKVLANSGASSESFAEPRGWALKWNGSALPDDVEHDGHGPSPDANDTF